MYSGTDSIIHISDAIRTCGNNEEEKCNAGQLYVDWSGNTALHQAVVVDAPDVPRVSQFLSMHPGIAGVRNRCGRIPLHYALDRSRSKVNVEIVRLLLTAYPNGAAEPDNSGTLFPDEWSWKIFKQITPIPD